MFRIFLLVTALAIGQLQVLSQTATIDQVLSELESVRSFSGVSISPDGHWLAWVESAADHSGNSNIYLLDRTDAAKPIRITAGSAESERHEHSVVWSPDSRQFTFMVDRNQIFMADARSRKVTLLTELKGYVTDVRWRPDGTGLAYLFAANGGGGGPLEAVPAQVGVIGAELHNQRIMVINSIAQNSAAVAISPAELNVYEYDWSPNGERFAAIAAPGPADNNWWTAKLFTLDVRSKEMKQVYAPPVDRQIAVPRWSPDGKNIAFIGGLMSDEGFLGGDLFTFTEDGGVTDVTPGIKASATGLFWRSNHDILYTEDVDGGGGIVSLNIATGSSELIWKGTEALHQDGNYPNFSLSSDGVTSAAIRSTWASAPEIWTGKIGDWKRATNANAGQRPHWGKAESVTWQSEGSRVQGWLLYPENFDGSKKYPMVVAIHGGPAGMRGVGWPSSHFDLSVMAGLGYFVFFPNARGSYGEGEDFTKANVKDFGGGDLRDILAGLDAVAKIAPIDEHRIGVTGWSYGGYMTMWTVTQTQRFRAAVAGAGIANWQSYYGQNSIDEWMVPYFGASVYDDPAVYAKSSPITFIKQVKTPTLVIVGERDGECPAPQSFEFWHALKNVGVPTQLVVYPGEGHSFHDAKDRVDVLRRSLAWFEQYLK